MVEADPAEGGMDAFETAMNGYRDAARRFLATCAGLPDAAWAAPRAGRHSIAEVAEHVALSNALFGARLARLAATADSDAVTPLEDGEIAHLFERAAEPPGIAAPTGSWTDRAEALPRIAASFAAATALPGAAPVMRRRIAAHPLFGPMDGVQWALFAAAHTERHRSEIIGLAG
jgi:hypothetical protein